MKKISDFLKKEWFKVIIILLILLFIFVLRSSLRDTNQILLGETPKSFMEPLTPKQKERQKEIEILKEEMIRNGEI